MLDANGNPTLVIDMANSFYIDWGSLINAIINFFLIAFVLFTIVKVINKVKEDNQKMKDELKKKTLDKNERKELKLAGISLKDKEAIKAYFEEKKAQEQAKAEEEARLLEEQAKAERLANPTVEDLLKDIKKLLESK